MMLYVVFLFLYLYLKKIKLSACSGFSSTKNIVHLADSAKNEDDSNNKHSGNLKDWSIEMPNAPYSNR
jgi:hypothetical protein